ncbi:Leucine-rich repeat containing protein [Entamoeba marina]
MIVLKYFDGLNTLEVFEKVSSNCHEAILSTKINPSYQTDSLQMMLSMKEINHVLTEIKVFENLDTLSVSSDVLQKMFEDDPQQFNSIKLIQITDFILKEKEDMLTSIMALKDKFVDIKVDGNYYIKSFFKQPLQSLRKITIRVGKDVNETCLNEYCKGLESIPYLSVNVVFHSKNVGIINALFQNFVRIKFIINWLDDTDIPNILSFIKDKSIVGCSSVNLHEMDEMFLNQIVFLPQRNGVIQWGSKMALHPRFKELLKKYYPSKLELIGTPQEILEMKENEKIHLEEVKEMQELYLSDTTWKRVKVVIPTQLRLFKVTNFCESSDIEGYDELKQRLGRCCLVRKLS